MKCGNALEMKKKEGSCIYRYKGLVLLSVTLSVNRMLFKNANSNELNSLYYVEYHVNILLAVVRKTQKCKRKISKILQMSDECR